MSAQLYLGDCLDIMQTLPAGSVDAVITDPPYGLGKKLDGGSWGNVKKWDILPDLSFLLRLAPVVVIWGGNYHNLPPSRCWFVWYKPDAPPSMADVELAWTNQDANAQLIRYPIAAVNKERVGHPTQKPISVMKWCIELLRLPASATILDPYMGSGTTGVACVQTGRNFIGVEIDPNYYAIAEKRIAAAEAQPPLFPVGVTA